MFDGPRVSRKKKKKRKEKKDNVNLPSKGQRTKLAIICITQKIMNITSQYIGRRYKSVS